MTCFLSCLLALPNSPFPIPLKKTIHQNPLNLPKTPGSDELLQLLLVVRGRWLARDMFYNLITAPGL